MNTKKKKISRGKGSSEAEALEFVALPNELQCSILSHLTPTVYIDCVTNKRTYHHIDLLSLALTSKNSYDLVKHYLFLQATISSEENRGSPGDEKLPPSVVDINVLQFSVRFWHRPRVFNITMNENAIISDLKLALRDEFHVLISCSRMHLSLVIPCFGIPRGDGITSGRDTGDLTSLKECGIKSGMLLTVSDEDPVPDEEFKGAPRGKIRDLRLEESTIKNTIYVFDVDSYGMNAARDSWHWMDFHIKETNPGWNDEERTFKHLGIRIIVGSSITDETSSKHSRPRYYVPFSHRFDEHGDDITSSLEADGCREMPQQSANTYWEVFKILRHTKIEHIQLVSKDTSFEPKSHLLAIQGDCYWQGRK